MDYGISPISLSYCLLCFLIGMEVGENQAPEAIEIRKSMEICQKDLPENVKCNYIIQTKGVYADEKN